MRYDNKSQLNNSTSATPEGSGEECWVYLHTCSKWHTRFTRIATSCCSGSRGAAISYEEEAGQHRNGVPAEGLWILKEEDFKNITSLGSYLYSVWKEKSPSALLYIGWQISYSTTTTSMLWCRKVASLVFPGALSIGGPSHNSAEISRRIEVA